MGGRYGGAAVHSIVLDHTGADRCHVAMSTGGVYRSLDGGSSWEPRNKGISAYFMPDPYPEFGQCVHKIAADAAVDGRLYAQNHHGVYRSDDDAGTGNRSRKACRRTSASLCSRIPAGPAPPG